MKNKQITVDTKNLLKFFALASIFIIFIVLVLSWITKPNKEDEFIEPEKTNPPAYTGVICPKDPESYWELRQGTDQTAVLIGERKYMYAKNGQFINSQIVITKNETQNSKVACGYIYIKAGTNNGSLQEWENLYVNPEDDFGGHLDTRSNLSDYKGMERSCLQN